MLIKIAIGDEDHEVKIAGECLHAVLLKIGTWISFAIRKIPKPRRSRTAQKQDPVLHGKVKGAEIVKGNVFDRIDDRVIIAGKIISIMEPDTELPLWAEATIPRINKITIFPGVTAITVRASFALL